MSKNRGVRLLLVRHGQTDWNVEGRYQGQADPPLNARGRVQAHAAAAALRNWKIVAIYTSPLLRARQTAEAISQTTGLRIRLEPRLMEIHQGERESIWELIPRNATVEEILIEEVD